MTKSLPWTTATINGLLTGVLIFIWDKGWTVPAYVLSGVLVLSIFFEIVVSYKSGTENLLALTKKLEVISKSRKIVELKGLVLTSIISIILSLFSFFVVSKMFTTPMFEIDAKGTLTSINLDNIAKNICFLYTIPLFFSNLGAWLGIRMSIIQPTEYSFVKLGIGYFFSLLSFPITIVLFALMNFVIRDPLNIFPGMLSGNFVFWTFIATLLAVSFQFVLAMGARKLS